MSQVRHSSVSASATSSAKPSDIVLKSRHLDHKALNEYEERLPEHIAKLERLTGLVYPSTLLELAYAEADLSTKTPIQ